MENVRPSVRPTTLKLFCYQTDTPRHIHGQKQFFTCTQSVQKTTSAGTSKWGTSIWDGLLAALSEGHHSWTAQQAHRSLIARSHGHTTPSPLREHTALFSLALLVTPLLDRSASTQLSSRSLTWSRSALSTRSLPTSSVPRKNMENVCPSIWNGLLAALSEGLHS